MHHLGFGAKYPQRVGSRRSQRDAFQMADMQKALLREEQRATKLLAGKVVARVRRRRDQEVLIEFADGTRLFVDVRDASPVVLELSVTGGALPEEA